MNRAVAGRSGRGVRSDCLVEITETGGSGVRIEMQSKVDVLYGRANRALLEELISFFKLDGVNVRVEDSGALPYTIAARFETAIRRLNGVDGTGWLPPARVQGTGSVRDRFRRSRLYLPGNDPKLAINACVHGADGLILDLEDSVASSEKDAARILVRNALRAVDFGAAERMVRINQLPLGLEDLDAIVPQHPDLILLPKVESAAQVTEAAAHIRRLQDGAGSAYEIYLMPIIESAKGAIEAYSIACASPSVVALAIGLEDYTADIGAERTLEGKESAWMRGAVLNAARAAGVQAIDTVFSDVTDMDGLFTSVLEAKALGFDGKGCIHPRQIPVVHRGFAPSDAEIEKAKRIVLAFDDAERQGLGVVSLGSKMIDPPVVKRAQRSIRLAIMSGLLENDWKETPDEQ
ncbi:HpcH/HpaI aldolase/citrate lyase family protein [bacterium]|nr:HpcH/HpaI aldolase/citrate lyase family protein [bacterium]